MHGLILLDRCEFTACVVYSSVLPLFYSSVNFFLKRNFTI